MNKRSFCIVKNLMMLHNKLNRIYIRSGIVHNRLRIVHFFRQFGGIISKLFHVPVHYFQRVLRKGLYSKKSAVMYLLISIVKLAVCTVETSILKRAKTDTILFL